MNNGKVEWGGVFPAIITPFTRSGEIDETKFRDLLETAKDLDADCMATGHYIQRKLGTHGPELHSAADANRDRHEHAIRRLCPSARAPA